MVVLRLGAANSNVVNVKTDPLSVFAKNRNFKITSLLWTRIPKFGTLVKNDNFSTKHFKYKSIYFKSSKKYTKDGSREEEREMCVFHKREKTLEEVRREGERRL